MREDRSSPNRSLLRLLLAASVAAALVLGLGGMTDRETLISLLRTVDPTWLALAFAVFCLGTVVRAFRFETLGRPHNDKALGPYLRVTAIHQLLLMVIPFRMGELSYPILMRSHLGRAIPHAVGDLLLVRLVDLVLAAIFLGLGLLALPGAAGDAILLVAAAVVVLGSWALFELPAAIRLTRRLLLSLRRVAPVAAPRPLREFMRELDHSVRGASRHALAPAAALGVVLMSFGVVRIYAVFAAFGIEASLLASALLLGASNLLGLIPLHGLGGLGPKQAGMAGVLILLGFASSTAASVTLLSQATLILFVTAVGAAGYASWLLANRRAVSRARG